MKSIDIQSNIRSFIHRPATNFVNKKIIDFIFGSNSMFTLNYWSVNYKGKILNPADDKLIVANKDFTNDFNDHLNQYNAAVLYRIMEELK